LAYTQIALYFGNYAATLVCIECITWPIEHFDKKWNRQKYKCLCKSSPIIFDSILFINKIYLQKQNLVDQAIRLNELAQLIQDCSIEIAQTVYIHIGCNATWIFFGPSIFTNESQVYLSINLLTFVYGGLLSALPRDHLTTQVPKTTKILKTIFRKRKIQRNQFSPLDKKLNGSHVRRNGYY